MASSRRAKIGITCIVFGILWLPIYFLLGPLTPLPELLKPVQETLIPEALACGTPILLLLGGLGAFLLDD